MRAWVCHENGFEKGAIYAYLVLVLVLYPHPPQHPKKMRRKRRGMVMMVDQMTRSTTKKIVWGTVVSTALPFLLVLNLWCPRSKDKGSVREELRGDKGLDGQCQ